MSQAHSIQKPPLKGEQAIALLQRMVGGEKSAWDEFLGHFGDLLYSQIFYTYRRYVPRCDDEEIQDVVQGLLLDLMDQKGRKLLSYQGRNGCSLAGWLRTVATHYALGRLRRRKEHISLPNLPDTELDLKPLYQQSAPSALEQASDQNDLEVMNEIISTFPSREKVVFQLFYQDECTSKEIGDFLDLKANHVDQLLFRIREKIRDYLNEQGISELGIG